MANKPQRSIRIIDYIGMVISVIAGLISVYAQALDPERSILLFVLLLGAILLFYLLSWPIDYFRVKMNLIESNNNDILIIKKDLNIIKDKLNFRADIAKLDTRISVVESKLK